MSSIVSAITGGGGKGVGFEAEHAQITNPTTKEQADAQYGNAQMGLAQQQDFLRAIQAQNGLGNQTATFNQLQGVANGTGPNPAAAMLNQATGANVANQAALMAGQRGSGANIGLIGRQAAQVGAGIQQNAAGQMATMQANQSLNALNQMGGISTNQANQQANATNAYTNAAQSEQSQILNSIAGVNSANVGNASGVNNANAAIQGQIAKGQMDLVGNVTSSAGAAMMAAEGGLIETIKSAFTEDKKPKPTPTPINDPDPAKAKPISDYFNSDKYAYGGGAGTPIEQSQGATSGPQSKMGQFFSGMATPAPKADPNLSSMAQGGKDLGEGIGGMISSLFSKPQASAPLALTDQQANAGYGSASLTEQQGNGGYAQGGKVPALVSPGETYLKPDKVKQVLKGANPLAIGERIPGTPKVPGNSYANDTVPKDLDPGGVVIPNSIMQSKDAADKAAKFVAAVLKKQALKKGK